MQVSALKIAVPNLSVIKPRVAVKMREPHGIVTCTRLRERAVRTTGSINDHSIWTYCPKPKSRSLCNLLDDLTINIRTAVMAAIPNLSISTRALCSESPRSFMSMPPLSLSCLRPEFQELVSALRNLPQKDNLKVVNPAATKDHEVTAVHKHPAMQVHQFDHATLPNSQQQFQII